MVGEDKIPWEPQENHNNLFARTLSNHKLGESRTSVVASLQFPWSSAKPSPSSPFLSMAKLMTSQIGIPPSPSLPFLFIFFPVLPFRIKGNARMQKPGFERKEKRKKGLFELHRVCLKNWNGGILCRTWLNMAKTIFQTRPLKYRVCVWKDDRGTFPESVNSFRLLAPLSPSSFFPFSLLLFPLVQRERGKIAS